MLEPGFLRSYAAVLRRELHSLAVLPQTYVIAAAYVVVSGVFFVSILGRQQLPDLERFYSNLAATLVVLVPIISMRGFAEERATGSLDMMLSWPLSRAATVLAKFSVPVIFSWLLISSSWLYVRILSRYGTVEIGKQAAGVVGLMALSAAFCAVALAVSARSASVAGGAFLAVLVLLSAWSVQYAESWPLGSTLAGLSPARRIEAAEQGVLYASDLAYFLVVVVLGLGLTLALLERQRGVARRQHARRLGVLTAGVAAGALVIGVAGASFAGEIDLTPTQRYTLTPASRNIARAVHAPVVVSAFVDPESGEAVQIRNLYRRYRAAGVNMSLDIVDPDREPGRMKALGVSGYGQLQVRVGDRAEIADHFGEIALTSAIYRAGRTDARPVCFTTGHGERSIDNGEPDGYSQLAGVLRDIGYEPRTIALAAAGGSAELRPCSLLIVAGGRGLLELDERVLLDDFVRTGGRMLFLSEGGQQEARSMNQILETFGVRVQPGTVEDVASLANDPASVVTVKYPSESPVTKGLSQHGLPTLVVGGQEIVAGGEAAPPDGGGDSVTPLLQTTGDAWVRGANGPSKVRTLAVAIDRSAIIQGGAAERGSSSLFRARIGVVGSVDVGSNRDLARFGNEEFLTSLVQWTATEAEIISASRDPGGVRKIELTAADQDDIVRRAVVFPGLAALVPLPILVRRMRRG
jgi:ABC-type transport system involved in multi-copper enzyme maturation permease subunit